MKTSKKPSSSVKSKKSSSGLESCRGSAKTRKTTTRAGSKAPATGPDKAQVDVAERVFGLQRDGHMNQVAVDLVLNRLGITKAEAKKMKAKFLETFPAVKEFIDQTPKPRKRTKAQKVKDFKETYEGIAKTDQTPARQPAGPGFKEVRFDCNIADRAMFNRILTRVADETAILVDTSLEMDLIACHLNGCPLDLDKLLKADAFTLIHDVRGIRDHMDRRTGQLSNHFLPRCAKPAPKTKVTKRIAEDFTPDQD